MGGEGGLDRRVCRVACSAGRRDVENRRHSSTAVVARALRWHWLGMAGVFAMAGRRTWHRSHGYSVL